MSDPFTDSNLSFDSPLEADFAWHIAKYLSDDVHLDKQVPVETICGRFVLDFVAANRTGLRVAFECDGKEFHHAARDEWRDAMILGAHAVDSIFRLRGSDLTYHMHDVLYVVALWHPELFSERGITNLETLASPEARQRAGHDFWKILIPYFAESESRYNPLFIDVERRTLWTPAGQRQFWEQALKFASEFGGGALDTVIRAFWKQKGV